MTTSQLITCKVNGVEVEAWVKNRLTVAQFLRDQLGLTGTKVSCEIQVCGSCTVLVDGSPISSCSVLAYRLQGKSVTTIEGVAERGHLNDVQEAFLNNFAFQCGFCTSGNRGRNHGVGGLLCADCLASPDGGHAVLGYSGCQT